MKNLVKYLEQQLNDIDLILEKQAQQFTPYFFHELRVEVKKIHSLFRLINFCFKHFKKNKGFKKIKQLFQQAGRVRELQVEENNFRKYFRQKMLQGFKNTLKQHQKREKEKFFLLKESVDSYFLKKTYNDLSPYLKKISKHQVEKYIEKKSDKINEVINSNRLRIKQLHTLRKELKDLRYIQKSSGLKDDSNLLLSKNKDLSNALGKWHDMRVITRHLETMLSSNQTEMQENEQLRKINALFKKKNKLQFNTINNRVKLLKTQMHNKAPA